MDILIQMVEDRKTQELVAPLPGTPCLWVPPTWAFVLVALFVVFAAPSWAQVPDPLPRQITPWEPLPVAERSTTSERLPVSVTLSSTSWTPIGPGPLGFVAGGNINSNVSGRIAGVSADPTDPNTYYIAPAGGGVWKTTNGGTSWTPLTDPQSSVSMGAVAVSASNPNVIYAGTGEANNSGDSNYGRGILVSPNGGSTWTLTTAAGAFNRLTTSKIAVDPTNPDIAYAAMSDFANNGLCCANTGIWKTVNGGTTWTNTTAATLTQQGPYSDVAIDPNNPSTVYMAIGNPFSGSIGQTFNGVYKSTNGGSTWTLVANAPNGTTTGRFAIAVSKSNSQVLYVSVSNPSTFGVLSVVRSDDGGSTFTTVTPPNYMGGQGWYDTWIAVDRSNSAIVYVAGAAGTNSILRSSNSGSTWTDIHTGGAPNFTSPHVDHHGIDFDANGRLLDGNDGGIYRLDTPTIPSWSDLNGNLATIQFQGIGLHPTDPNRAIAGSQDNGTELYTGSPIWTETDGGDGGFAKFSQTDGNRVYHIAPVASFGSASFFRRSDNGGNSWVSKTSGFVSTSTFLFYPPFVVDPLNGNRLLTGGDRVYESTNGADLWIPISTPGSSGWPAGISVSAIGLAPSDVNTIYAATGGSNIFVTTNHGTTWTNHSIAGAGRVADLQVDPANAAIAYAVINNFGDGKVFRSVNGGTTWANITTNLPDQPVWSLQIDPGAPNTYYVGADDGIYRTTNGGTSWSRFGLGFPNAQVYQIELSGSLQLLAAATHGRGAWEILITPISPPATVTNVTSSTPDGSYTAGAVISIQVTFSGTVNVTGTPQLTLNSGGTASYSSGGGTSTLTFLSTVAAGQNSADLDYTSSSALSLNGGTINDTNGNAANLTLPTPGGPGSLGFNKNIIIDTTAPTIVSYKVLFGSQTFNLIGSTRIRLPWQVSGIQVVFSEPMASGNINSLTGVSTTGFSGLGTSTLTWTISPVSIGAFTTSLLGTGGNALKDVAGNAFATFNQNFKVLQGDFNDDGIVQSADMVSVNNARFSAYNIFADVNGDGVVNISDVSQVRSKIGTTQP